MNHGSLFSGIGGFDLAAEKMGWNNVFHCEWNSFGQKILKYYWPHAKSFNDIKESDFSIYRGVIDIITGGFPCQPYSSAGKRLGKEDDRHLWPEMLRVIRQVQPRWVVGENVRGLTNWNGGLVFDEVQADLETSGYEVLPFLLPACAVNAPHRRDRIWFVSRLISNTGSNGFNTDIEFKKIVNSFGGRVSLDEFNTLSGNRITTNASSERLSSTSWREQPGIQQQEESQKRSESSRIHTKTNEWSNFPTQSPLRPGDDGISSRLDPETVFKGFNKRRSRISAYDRWIDESIKAGGNAIVPQVAMQIFKAIEMYSGLGSKHAPA
jgi:DNA (cytosine-5)-methyltransferase 1